jgi:ABC-type sugar transport system permease subunit/ABC-type glycerol-3-phosphate transport system substrate-binding protein
VLPLLLAAACGGPDATRRVVTISGSEVGAEGEVLRRQLARFEAANPGLHVELRATPDAAGQRHQLYVQWLNARSSEPDVLQLDVVWTPEFAAAGWLLPLRPYSPDTGAFFPSAIRANEWRGELYALPWFVDVGMLYWRTDLMERAPRTFDELSAFGREAMRRGGLPYGFVWQGARYEGLVTVFQEVLGGWGGQLMLPRGEVTVDAAPAVGALGWLRATLTSGLTPPAALTWQEEQARFAFQNGQGALMRNWPYAYALMQDPQQSRVAGRFAVAPMPRAPGGAPTASLGGAQLAINAFSRDPEAAWRLVEFLTRPEQMLERAQVAGQFPPQPALYEGPLEGVLPMPPAEALRIIDGAEPRPVTPVYTELSDALQVELHRALTAQRAPRPALEAAAVRMRAILASAGLAPGVASQPPRVGTGLLIALGLAIAAGLGWSLLRQMRRRPRGSGPREGRLALALVAPAVGVIGLVAIFPLVWTAWESLHLHDLRMPWRGRPFVGLANYLEMALSARFWQALAHTAVFTAATVSLELLLGLALALALNRGFAGRGLVRASVLVPWAIPTVVAGLIWRFMFDTQTGIANAVLADLGVVDRSFVWFIDATAAWVPLILSDVWKTTPFVALLLLAGLQGIDEALYEAARVDGASTWQQFRHITLPLLRPALLVALLFRTLDAFRVFDLVYVMTGGGPGTATEPVSLLTFDSLLQNLRFGYGSALSVVVFAATMALAAVYVRVLGADIARPRE